jgi:hypothetical protein
MARQKNPIATKQLKYPGNRLLELYLDDLVRTGFYGRTASEVAERLVSRGIKKAIQDHEIEKRPGTDLDT